jgi:hypothetical protein
MKLLPFLASIMGLNKLSSNIFAPQVFSRPTPSKRVRDTSGKSVNGCKQSKKDDGLPRGYPGAKMARKAEMKFLAVRHCRGLRQDGATC